MEYTTSKQINLRKMNRNRIYRLVYDSERISKPDIAQKLGLSLPTVIQNVKDLQQAGLLEEGEAMESTGGRKAMAISCVKNARYSIGIDITKNQLSVVLINLSADIISSIQMTKPYENTPGYYTELGEIVRGLVSTAKIDEKHILGAGFSVPGAISEDGQMIVYSHVLEVSGLQCATVSREIPYPTMFCNDANAAGIAEMWSAKFIRNAVYLSLSNTVGGSIILDNKLYLGENQRGGEFGHMTLVQGGLACYCGRKGCADSYCSAQVLSRHTGGNLKLFFERLENDDPSLLEIWRQYLSYLTTLINNLTVAFDCNIILGGYVGVHLDKFIGNLKKKVADINLFSGNEEYIQACKYKYEAAAVGAALLYIQPFLRQI